MKSIKYISLLSSVIILCASLWLMWNTAIAADEQITVGSFLNQYYFIYWGFLIISGVLLLSNLYIVIKHEK